MPITFFGKCHRNVWKCKERLPIKRVWQPFYSQVFNNVGWMLMKNGYHSPLIGDAPLQANQLTWPHAMLRLDNTVMLVPPAAERKKPGVMGIVYDKWLGTAWLHSISSNLILAKCSWCLNRQIIFLPKFLLIRYYVGTIMGMWFAQHFDVHSVQRYDALLHCGSYF